MLKKQSTVPTPGCLWDTEYLLPEQKENTVMLFQRAVSQVFIASPKGAPRGGITKEISDTNMWQMSILRPPREFSVLGLSFKILDKNALCAECLKSINGGVLKLLVGGRLRFERLVDDLPETLGPGVREPFEIAKLAQDPFLVKIFWPNGFKIIAPTRVRVGIWGVDFVSR